MGAFALFLMAFALGGLAFAIGMLPFTLSLRTHIEKLSTLGSGLIIGAALGVIIPEGVETISEAVKDHFPTSKAALALLLGFAFMLIMEQSMHAGVAHSGPGSHSYSPVPTSRRKPDDLEGTTEFDAELAELEGQHGPQRSPAPRSPVVSDSVSDGDVRARAYSLTLGLVVHGLSDGLALGISALSDSASDSSELSIVVFLALLLHKAPATLALSTSLLGLSLPRAECKKHIAIFSSSTPIGAVASYAAFSFLGLAGNAEWTGLTILFSGGSFLYVASLLQSSQQQHGSDSVGIKMRTALIMVGMFIPVIIGMTLGHGHEHGHEDVSPIVPIN